MSNVIKTESSLVPSVSMGELVEEFLKGRKQTTIKAYKEDLSSFSRFVGVTSIAEAAKALLSRPHGEANLLGLKYKNSLIESKLQSATVNRKLSALRSLVKFARILGIVSYELEVENQENQAYRDVKGVGSEGIKKIFQFLEGKIDQKSIRDLALLRMLFDLGLRRQEVCLIELKDLNLEQFTLAILGKARNQKELLTVPAQTIETIKNWLLIRGNEDGPLFYRLDKGSDGCRRRLSGTGLYTIIKELGRKVGIEKMTVHKIRHSAISTCCEAIAENKLGIETLLKFSRHKSLNTALIYMDHLDDKQGQLAELVSKKVG